MLPEYSIQNGFLSIRFTLFTKPPTFDSFFLFTSGVGDPVLRGDALGIGDAAGVGDGTSVGEGLALISAGA